MSDLPPGWEWSTLGEIAETSLGKMLDKGRSTGSHLTPYLRNVNVQWGRFDLSSIQKMDIAPDERVDYAVEPGDLLVCEGGEIGRCAVWQGSSTYMAFQKALHRVRPHPGIDARYIRHVFEHLSVSGMLLPYSSGSTIKHLPQMQLRRLPIPVPPAAEQRRIVDAIEDHLSRLDAASRSLADARRREPNLVASILEAELATAHGAECRLGDLLNGIEAGRSFGGAARPATEDEWGIIKVSAMTWGEFRAHENKVVSDVEKIDPRHEIRPGDILVSRANTKDYVGAPVLVEETRPKLLLSDKSIRLKLKPDVDPRWLVEVLASPSVRRQISQRATGNQDSMRNISQSSLASLRLPAHCPDQQRSIAASIVEKRRALRRLDAELARIAESGEALRRSLMAEAFAGRLVPPDPGDEPASVLLERIRSDWTAKQPVLRSKARRKQGPST